MGVFYLHLFISFDFLNAIYKGKFAIKMKNKKYKFLVKNWWLWLKSNIYKMIMIFIIKIFLRNILYVKSNVWYKYSKCKKCENECF